jgi:hydroxymethylpyrimidine/phosphomethylpyrimidine kinase
VQASQIAPDENRSPIAVLVIGGLDPGGGAGVLRDTLTAAAHGARPIVVGTAWTEQGRQVHRVEARDAEALLDSVRQALAANPAAVKVGMVPDSRSVKAILEGLRNFVGPIVVDPVLASSRGRPLFGGPADDLVPLLARATLVTPNTIEAAALSGLPVNDLAGVAAAARALAGQGKGSILIKGGHLAADALVTDTLLANGELHRLSRERAGGGDVRGTGCALATAIAVRLGRGEPLLAAVEGAAEWLARARAAAVAVGGERHLGWVAA